MLHGRGARKDVPDADTNGTIPGESLRYKAPAAGASGITAGDTKVSFALWSMPVFRHPEVVQYGVAV